MSPGERISTVDNLMAWRDEIPFHYEYTAGVAGEKFLRGLKGGQILGSKCSNCHRTYLPPKIYCVNCYLEIKKFVPVGPEGRVSALAKSHVDFQGRGIAKATTFVFVTF